MTTPPADVTAWILDRWRAGDRVVGVQGTQGSGKSTLCRQLTPALQEAGAHVVTVSLDDGYLSHDARQTLAATVHPLFRTRGVPGTHDVPLLRRVLHDLRAGRATSRPHFDKVLADRVPSTPVPAGTDLVLFEGWCVGLPPIPPERLAVPINALERDEDPDATWRHAVAAALAGPYAALWAELDSLLVLQAPGWEVVAGWRTQQELGLPAARRMAPAAHERFLQHYQRWTCWGLESLPARADAVRWLDAHRRSDRPLEVHSQPRGSSPFGARPASG